MYSQAQFCPSNKALTLKPFLRKMVKCLTNFVIEGSSDYQSTVKTLYNDQPRDPKIVAVVER